MRLSSEQIQAMLDDVHALVEREISRHEGIVDVVILNVEKIDEGGAYRLSVSTAIGTVNNVRARRRHGEWEIQGPAIRTRNGWAPMLELTPETAAAIGRSLDSALAAEIEGAA